MTSDDHTGRATTDGQDGDAGIGAEVRSCDDASPDAERLLACSRRVEALRDQMQPAAGWDALHERLRDVPLAAMRRTNRRLRRMVVAAASIGFLLGAATFQWIRPAQSRERAFDAGVKGSASPLSAELAAPMARSLEVFSHLASFYEGRTAWVLRVDDRMDVGLDEPVSAPLAAPRTARGIAVRVFNGANQTLSCVNVTGLAPCSVEVESVMSDGRNVRYELTLGAVDDMTVRVQAEISVGSNASRESGCRVRGQVNLRSNERQLLGVVNVDGELLHVELSGLWGSVGTTGVRT